MLTNWERNRKLGYTSFPLMPRLSVLDPSYLMTLPAEQTVYGFEDMFCHTCEQYFSYPVDDNLSDEIAEGCGTPRFLAFVASVLVRSERL